MSTFRNQTDKTSFELDKFIASLVMFVSLVASVWLVATGKQPIYIVGGVLVILACAIYIIARNRFPLTSLSQEIGSDRKLLLILNIFFFILLACSILSIYLRPELYVRPTIYFVLIALMVSVVGIEILFCKRNNRSIYLILAKIILIALSLEWTVTLLFPNVIGVDPWLHQQFTSELLNEGYIPTGTDYSVFPTFSLLIGETSLITGLEYNFAALYSVGSPHIIISVLFVFLLGRLIQGETVGLLAALFLGTANHFIQMGYWIIPNTLGAIFILPVLYLLFRQQAGGSSRNILLSILLMGILIITHPMAAMCLSILLLVSWVGFKLYAKLSREAFIAPATLNIVILFSTGMFGYWMFMSENIEKFVSLIEKIFIATVEIAPPIATMQNPFSEQLFAWLGTLLFFAISLVGLLYMISRFGNKYGFSTAIGGLVLFGISFIALFGDLSGVIIQHRWIYMAEIILAIPVGIALFLIYRVAGKKLALLLISVITFFMIISIQVNMENRTFFRSMIVRSAFIESELKGIGTISSMYDGIIGTDRYSNGALIYYFNRPDGSFIAIDDALVTGDFDNYQSTLIIIREEIAENPFRIGEGVIQLDYDPYFALADQGFSQIYNSGTISGFVYQKDEFS